MDPLGICPRIGNFSGNENHSMDGVNCATSVYTVLPISISNLSLKPPEALKAVNHCGVRLLALMTRCQPSLFYGNSRDQISSYCSVSQEAAENGFPQQS